MSIKHLVGAAVIAAALFACNKPKPVPVLLDHIPADATVLAHADLDGIMKMAGCTVEEGRLFLAPKLEQMLSKRLDETDVCVIERALEYADAVNLADSYIFTVNGVDGFVIAAPLLEIDTDEDDGFSTYPHSTWVSVMPESIWFLRDREQADSIYDAAEANPASADALVARTLELGGDLQALVRMPKTIFNPAGDDFDALTASVKLSDRSINMRVIPTHNGRLVSAFGKMPAITDSASLLVPSSPALWVEAGINKPTLDVLAKLFAPKSAIQLLALNMGLSLVPDDGGTFGVALTPGGNAETIKKFDLSTWVGCALMPVKGTVDIFSPMLEKMSNFDLYFNIENGYATACNWDAWDEDAATTSISAEPGEKMAAQLSIPYNSQLMKALALKSGYNASVSSSGDDININVSLLGPDPYIVPALINDLNR